MSRFDPFRFVEILSMTQKAVCPALRQQHAVPPRRRRRPRAASLADQPVTFSLRGKEQSVSTAVDGPSQEMGPIGSDADRAVQRSCSHEIAVRGVDEDGL